MELDPSDLDKISAVTLQHYDAHAEDFRDGTYDHDVTQNIAALLHHIEVEPPLTILDFGCGPGRDLKAFTTLGHCAVGLDGAERFVAMARDATGCDVWQQDFLHLDLPAAHFDGIFANAALFHVPSQALPRVLRQLHATLKLGGVLFTPTRAARIRKAGATAATASSMISKHGADTWRARDSSKLSTITGPPACRVSGSRG
jgi:SAM-dependent methyltransferase